MSIQIKNDNVLISDINSLQQTIGGGSLATSAQTLIGGINENKNNIDTNYTTLNNKFDNYLPLIGGNLTGAVTSTSGLALGDSLTFNKVYNAIRYVGTSSTDSMIRFLDNASNSYGIGVSIGGGGATIIGGGESALNMESALTANDSEVLYLCNDNQIDFYTNCQDGASSAMHTYIDNAGTFSGGAKRLAILGSISGSTHAVALQSWFNSHKATTPRNQLINFYSSAYGNGSVASGYFLTGYDSNPYGGFFVCHYTNARYVGISNGTYTQYELTKSASSSRKVKENISLMTNEQANNLLNLNVINFDYKPNIENGKKNQKGIIIEELIDTMPECIVNLNDYNGNNSEILQVDYTKFVPYLIKMVQIQQKQINALKKGVIICQQF